MARITNYSTKSFRLGSPAVLRALLAVLIVGFSLVMGAGPTSAQTVTDTDLDTIADELISAGRYLEFTADGELDSAIDQANNDGVAFVWLDNPAADPVAAQWADGLSDRLVAAGSRYHTVVVLTTGSVVASSSAYGDAAVISSIDNAFASFATGNVADGLSTFAGSLGQPTSTATTSAGSGSTSGSGSGSGFSLGTLLLPLIVLGGGFWLFSNWRKSRAGKLKAKNELAADRAEVREQLKANADRVMRLGDEVILANDPELIDLYEKASRTYQDVSHAIETADDADEIDELDDRIDEAEWQFEVIEARLAGKTPPPSPAEIEAKAKARAAAEAKAAQDRPALGPNESIGDRPPYQSRRYPSNPYPYGRSRGGGFGSLGGVLGPIILGQTMGRQSRRTTRRNPRVGSGGLGGGVLRPRGSSRGGGRSFGSGSRGRGGRSF